MSLGPFLLHAPWALLGLALLPLLWWLIRYLPPPPRRVWFPPLHLLEGLRSAARALQHPNPWLLLLRMAICALVLAALADIGFRTGDALPPPERESTRLIVLDDGWAGAPHWQARMRTLERLLSEAERDGREVLLLPGASSPEAFPLRPVGAAKARQLAEGLQPRPWGSDRIALAGRLDAALEERAQDGTAHGWIAGVEPIWIDDGIEQSDNAGGAERLAAVLRRLGAQGVAPRRLSRGADAFPLALRPATVSEDADAVLLSPAGAAPGAAPVVVEAFDGNGKRLGLLQVRLDGNSRQTPLRFDLSALSSGRLARIAVRNHATAAAVMLQGAGARRLPVALLDANPAQAERPYSSGLYYLRRALAPFARLRLAARGEEDALRRMLEEAPAVVVLDDVARLSRAQRSLLSGWVEKGGILVRFAGANTARLAEDGEEALLPVRLRQDERVLGGALSWDAPRPLAPFGEESPFHGLQAAEEVAVSRQILSLPEASGAARESVQVWARLADGSPLVSARAKGRGLLVLFHVTAAPDWSTLPLSGLYVDMLRRILRLSPGAVAPGGGAREGVAVRAPESANMLSLRPFLTLDGHGVLGAPPPEARAVAAAGFAEVRAGPAHPPGFYGNAGYLEAINVLESNARLLPLRRSGGAALASVAVTPLEGRGVLSLTAYFLWLAFLLLLLDSAVALKSLAPAFAARARPAAAAVLLLLLAVPSSAWAQGNSVVAKPIPEALRTFTLAYVRTGNPQVDDMSRDGLRGLARELHARTTVYAGIPADAQPGAPIAVNIGRDELAFFPLLYWPVLPGQQGLAPPARRAVADYLRHGGMILFDTRDRHLGAAALQGGASAGERALRRLLADVDVPALMPVSREHALGKSFYLLDEFPGRHAGGRVWVARETGDGRVSPVVIGGHDWAAAWAVNALGHPLILPLPGRERQREMARRFGVNLVLYALTGNYKQDQVHLPILLERLAH